jgi:hypothetical protein
VKVEMKASAGSNCVSRPASSTVTEPPAFGAWPELVPVVLGPPAAALPLLLDADDPHAVRTAAARAQPAMSVRRRRL